jgi:hypothetical protein
MKLKVFFFLMIPCWLILPASGFSEDKDPLKKNLSYLRKPVTYSPAWGSKTISYTHSPRLMEYFRTYSPHGLAFQSIWLVANVMDQDGQKYNLMRECKTTDSTLALASLEKPGLNSQAVPLFNPNELFLGRIFYEMDEKDGFVTLRPFPSGEAFQVEIRPQQLAWKDANGRIDLDFKALGPALEYYCPGQFEDNMYRSEPFWVEGKVNGKAVNGFGVIDMAWGPLGSGFLQSKIYKILEENWIIWLNVYEDGSKECGVYVDGIDQFQACYFNKNGQAKVTQNNKLTVSHTLDGFIKGATLRMDEHTFEYISESRVMQMASWVSWASGRVINLKESRKPVKTFAWFEFFPKSKNK